MRRSMKTKVLAGVLGAVMTASLLAGCGTQNQGGQQAQTEAATNAAETKAEETKAEDGKTDAGDTASQVKTEKNTASAEAKEGEVLLPNRKLNVSVIQMPMLDTAESLQYLSDTVDGLMYGTLRPELVVGVEDGLGFTPQRMDSDFIDYLGAIAKKYGIYFVPGTFREISDDLPEGETYNTCPVFGPDGELIDVYRKKAPYYPVESNTPSSSSDYCTFYIPEKDVTVGLQICYDQFFPEISRTLALEGAELILTPSYDPAEYDFIPDVIPRARALENECYYIWTNGVNGPCGNSTIVDPEGQVIYKCDSTEMTYTTTLDFARVTEKRLYGQDQHLNSLRKFNLQYPYAGRVAEAPVYEGWPELTLDRTEYDNRVSEIGMSTMPRELSQEMQAEQDKLMDEKMKSIQGSGK